MTYALADLGKSVRFIAVRSADVSDRKVLIWPAEPSQVFHHHATECYSDGSPRVVRRFKPKDKPTLRALAGWAHECFCQRFPGKHQTVTALLDVNRQPLVILPVRS